MMNRDLDAEIVKTIFKWRYIKVSPDYNGENACEILFDPNKEPTQDWYECLPRVGKPHKGFFAPSYSSELTRALELAQYVKLPGSITSLTLHPETIAKACLEHFKTQNPLQ